MLALLARRGSLAAVGFVALLAGCGGVAPGENESVGRSESGLTANDKIAFDYFLAKGLTNYQAAGIVGNLDQESGMSPTAVQPGGPGRGIAQWSVGGRWDTDTNDNATAYAKAQGASLSSLSLQLDFIWYELTTFSSYGLAPLRQSADVTAATIAFEKDFEGCGNCQEATRISYAKAALAAYGSDSVDGGLSADAGVPCDVPGVGTGQCMLTSACAALPNHVSTPGYCPGAADIECCTGPSDDGGAGDAGEDAPASSDGGAGNPPPEGQDAAGPSNPTDGGKTVLSGEASVMGDSSTTTGCAISARGAGGERTFVWLLGGLALALLGRRRRQRAAALRAPRASHASTSLARASSCTPAKPARAAAASSASRAEC